MPEAANYDVVIVGAGLAGCTAARLFAQRGLRVALIEQHADLDWHKRMCTHYIQACAVETIQRLGLEPLVEEAGGVRSRMEIWTRWGWIQHAGPSAPEMYGYSIRRQTLDPLVRRLAANTPGVELLRGWTADRLLQEGDRFTGVRLHNTERHELEVHARLVVAADGRNSSVTKMAGVPLREEPNNRFATFAYYRNLPLESGDDSQFWMLDPDAGYALPNDDGITLLCCWVTKDKWEEFRKDREGSFEQFFRSVPRGPDLSQAERVSEIMGALDLPILLRTEPQPGFIAIGDASLAADPLWGVGCGWAFQSAEWLVDHTAPALLSGGDLDRALRRYYKRHRAGLAGHYISITRYARGRRFSLFEKLFFRAAAQDQQMAETILAFGARRIGLGRLFRPRTLARAIVSQFRAAKPHASTIEHTPIERRESELPQPVQPAS